MNSRRKVPIQEIGISKYSRKNLTLDIILGWRYQPPYSERWKKKMRIFDLVELSREDIFDSFKSYYPREGESHMIQDEREEA